MSKHFSEESQAQGICFSLKNTSNEKEKAKKKNRAGFTASGLHNESSKSYESRFHNCVY